jgi:hypothetical protein
MNEAKHDKLCTTSMKEALIVWGGWDGHQPRECADIIARLLRTEGLQV